MDGKQAAAIGGGAALVVGSFMDWATVLTGFGTLSVKGLDGDGKLTAAAGVLAILMFLANARFAAIWGAGFSLAGGAVAGYDYQNISESVREIDAAAANASVGTGLYVCLGGAILGFIAGLNWSSELKRRDETGQNEMPLDLS